MGSSPIFRSLKSEETELGSFFLLQSFLFRTKDFLVRDFGAKGDGITLNVATIQKVIDFSHEQGGGRVAFTLGDFVTGLFYLKLGVTKCEVVRKRKRLSSCDCP